MINLHNTSHQRVVVTGGAGFIGSNFIDLMVKKYPNYSFISIDKLTYCGNLDNLIDIQDAPNYGFIKADICDESALEKIIEKDDTIVNFAAESHVDNSILDPHIFIKTNVLGTQILLDIARKKQAKLFVQISTDEVYGSLNFDSPSSKESDPLIPSSQYSASKAAAELICMANFRTFAQPVIITRSSNNFGPYQFPEKVIPLFITNLLENKEVPLYGEGKNIRDWIYVADNCSAIDFVIHNGVRGNAYNIGGGNEIRNIELTKTIIKIMGKDESLIKRVADRPGHDLRYSLDCSKIFSLGWKPRFKFEEALIHTVKWYTENKWWWEKLKKIPGKRTS